MHNLAVLSEYGCEAYLLAIRIGYAVNLSAHEFLCYARHCKAHCGGVHLVADGTCKFHLSKFLGLFHRAHLHNGQNQLERSIGGLLAWMNAEQVVDEDFSVVAIGRKEMHLSARSHCRVDCRFQLCKRSTVGHTHLGSHVGHFVDRAIPHDVLNVDIVTEYGFGVVVNID